MNRLMKAAAMAALLGLALTGSASADSKQALAASGKQITHKGPVRGAIRLSRPIGRPLVGVGRAVRPGRAAARLARGIGRAARGIGRAAVGPRKVFRPFRPFRKRVIIP